MYYINRFTYVQIRKYVHIYEFNHLRREKTGLFNCALILCSNAFNLSLLYVRIVCLYLLSQVYYPLPCFIVHKLV